MAIELLQVHLWNQ